MLARKWRPQIFADVVGQEHVLTALENGLSLGRIHHAYLLSGIRGVGKTTIARLLAKGLNCKTAITSKPCGHCDNCREIEQGRFVDLIEIDAASRTKVEDTRELLDNVQYAPACGRFKLYLIDEVHMLSRHSFNALLKTLEEPPEHVKFLLATTDPKKLPATVLSRCLQFHLKALKVEQIRGQLAKVLQQEDIAAAPRALQLLARAATGSMRDALSLADQAIAMGKGEISDQVVSLMLGTLNTEQPLALIEALANADGVAIMSQLAQCAARGMDWDALLLEILNLLHRLAIAQLLPGQLNDESDPDILLRLRALASQLTATDLQLYYQIMLIGRKDLPFVPDPMMGVEMALLRALAFHPTAVEVGDTTPASVALCQNESSNSAPKDYLRSHTGVRLAPMVKARSRTAPGLSTFKESKKITGSYEKGSNRIADTASSSSSGNVAIAEPVEEGEQENRPAFVHAVYENNHARDCCLSEAPTQNIATRHFSERAEAEYQQASEDSLDTRRLTDQHLFSLPSSSKPSKRHVTTINSTDKSLMEGYVNSGGDDDEAALTGKIGPGTLRDAKLPAPFIGVDSYLLVNTTPQRLQTQIGLLRPQESKQKSRPEFPSQKEAVRAVKQPEDMDAGEQYNQQSFKRSRSPNRPLLDAYRWRSSQKNAAVTPVPRGTLKGQNVNLEHKITSELMLCLTEELQRRDHWAAQVNRLALPQLAQQLALNTWKEELAPGKFRLHLKTSQRHLHSVMAQSILRNALSADLGVPVELTITEDNNSAIKTPTEWHQEIYKEKLMRAKKAMRTDAHIQMLKQFFDAELDEDSIRLV